MESVLSAQLALTTTTTGHGAPVKNSQVRLPEHRSQMYRIVSTPGSDREIIPMVCMPIECGPEKPDLKGAMKIELMVRLYQDGGETFPTVPTISPSLFIGARSTHCFQTLCVPPVH